MSDIRFNSWLHRSGTGGVYQDSSGRVGIGTSVGMNCLVNSGPNALTFGTGTTPAERGRIDTSGRVLLGTTTVGSATADDLTVATSGDTGITVRSGTSDEGNIFFADGTSGNSNFRGYVQYNHSTNALLFGTNASERLKIDSSGNINVGTAASIFANGNITAGIVTASASDLQTGPFNVGTAATISANGNATFSGIVTSTAFIPSVGWLSNRNIIINGGMLVAQRATSSTDTEYRTVDRFGFIKTNTDNLAFAQKQTDSYPNGFSKCYEIDITTAESALAADELAYVRYKVEAQDLRPFYNNDGTGKDFVLSFYVRTKQTGTYQVSIHKEDNTTRFVSATYAVATADTWQRVEIPITGDTGTSGINADNGQGFDITWKLAAGTDYTSGTPVTSWGSFSNSVFAAGHAVNVLDNAANYFRITGVQLELGSVATPFESRTYADELIRCKRYYQRSTDSSRGTDYTLELGSWHSPDAQISQVKSGTYYDWRFNWEVEMRTAPTFTFYGSSNEGDIHIESVAVGSKQVDWNNNTTELSDKGCTFRHIEDGSDGNYTSGNGNAFGLIAYQAVAEL